MPFAPVTKMFWEKNFAMKSNASVINKRLVLMVPLLLPPLAAVGPASFEKTSNKELLSASQSIQVMSWFHVERKLPSLTLVVRINIQT